MNSSYTEWAWPWWTVIVMINVVNLVVCAVVYRRSLVPKDGSDSNYRRRMRIMGVIFTLVAAYRAVFVSRYTAQLAWFDSLANSSLLIRMFAVAAELSFSGLIALAMIRVNRDLPAADATNANKFKSFMTTKSPYILITCIFLAQFFATGGLITKSQTLFAIEETLWTLGFLAVLPLAIIQLRRVYAIKDEETVAQLHMLRKSTVLIAAWCVFYCCYGLFYHLPLETWTGAINQLETGLPVIKTGASAITDAFLVVNESKAYSDWGFGFLLWHSAYFSICVWIAIFLMQAPRKIHHDIENSLK
ncbi:hypothetical protein ACFLXI_07575 [Chloroflexota bacterium]